MRSSRSEASDAHPDFECEGGMCAAGSEAAAEAGARVLRHGGNAVDAAVAAAFAAFVVEPIDCGLGGFARIAVRTPQGRHVAWDGYVCAPQAAHEAMFEVAAAADTYYGHPPTAGDAARYGPRAVAVPGAVAALGDAHAEHGRLPWREVLAPAIDAARAGVPFTWRDALVIGRLQPWIEAQPEAAAVLLPGGRPPLTPVQTMAGDRLDTSALARTLIAIAEEGARGFYEGALARALCQHVQRRGGVLSEADLKGYRTQRMEEPPLRYRHTSVTTCLDPVGRLALKILERLELGSTAGAVRTHHLVAEAMGVAYADVLGWWGDPEHVASPVAGLASDGFAALRANMIEGSRALPRPIAPADPWRFDDAGRSGAPTGVHGEREGTSQVVAADAEGTLVAITTAVGWDFGSLVYVPELGIFLNNGMSTFDPRPGRAASIAPGKRPLFGVPVVVASCHDGAGLAVAGSGGYRITSGVLHALVHRLDYGHTLAAALALPRVHCQGRETFVDARIDAEVQLALAALKHEVVSLRGDPSTWHFGRVCAIERRPDGTLSGSASPSWLTALAS